ncbi:MAG: hypothetical protein HC790_06340 [Acaryochloridaceae cyanobacterium CSU_3_4]|nr:hypothetical protein [Acaryochloridaceae cyanobacterium CSU_3_4]
MSSLAVGIANPTQTSSGLIPSSCNFLANRSARCCSTSLPSAPVGMTRPWASHRCKGVQLGGADVSQIENCPEGYRPQ